MKRLLFAIFIAGCLLPVAAQPSYKYILQHLDEMSDREALYRLNDHQVWYPKKPHQYYLMGNINYRLIRQEHSIVDYKEKHWMLYSARVYYGNCRAFMKNEHIKADMYPLAAKNGKVDEKILYDWLTLRMDTLQIWQTKLEELYGAFSDLALRYDTCLTLFTGLNNKYYGVKDAALMCDSADEAVLDELQIKAKKLPGDIKRFQKALKDFPIEGYQPEFTFKPIVFYRIDGLTGVDFLQSDIALWNYTDWIDNFRSIQNQVGQLRREMSDEQKRLLGLSASVSQGGSSDVARENKRLLNRINIYDTKSPLAELMHLHYLAVAAEQMGAIVSKMYNTEGTAQDDNENLIISLQLLYRMRTLQSEARENVVKDLAKSLLEDSNKKRYSDFLQAYYPDDATLSKAPAGFGQRIDGACVNAEALLIDKTKAIRSVGDAKIQINEMTEALVSEDGITFQAVVQAAE